MIQQTADYFARSGVYDKWYHFISCDELIKAVLAKDGDPEAFELELGRFKERVGYDTENGSDVYEEISRLKPEFDGFIELSYSRVDRLYRLHTSHCKVTDEQAIELGATK